MTRLSFSDVEIQRLFGHEAAEDEDPVRLKEYYFKTSVYDQVVSNLPLRILVGHKGIGKSALFQVAIIEDRENHRLPILIKPDDIVGLGENGNNFLEIIRNWKEGLNEIIARKVLTAFDSNQPNIKASMQHYGGMIVDFLHETFKNSTPVDLDPAKQIILKQFLNTRSIIVYIDDLDRGWEGLQKDVKRISALLNAVRDICNENRGISFKISLRSDVYYLVRTSDESTDKIEGSVIWQSWTNHEIFVLLIKRIETFFGRGIDEEALLQLPQSELALYLPRVFEPVFIGQGHWKNAPIHRVLMSLIRKRPRDLVKLCTQAAVNAREKRFDHIKTLNFTNIFERYSQARIQDTINEFRSELPEIERLLLNMKPSKKERTSKQGFKYKTDALLNKIENIMQGGSFKFANGNIAEKKDLAAFMYKINFLTARKEISGEIVRKYFEENRYLYGNLVDFGFDWEVHPAYRWALQPDDPKEIFHSLELSAED
jgi:hypothetical protein